MSLGCYLCGDERRRERPGKVRDSGTLKVLECSGCGLVFLSSFDHIKEGFYEQSGMHDTGWDLETWRRETARDDDRRFAFLRDRLSGKRVLDFGAGNAGFLLRAAGISAEAAGIEPERRRRPTHALPVQGLFGVHLLVPPPLPVHAVHPAGDLLARLILGSSGRRQWRARLSASV